MPFNQLFLVLLGGFIFVSQWRRTKFYTRRVDGHRLIFFSAVAGIGFLLIAVAIDALLAQRFPALVEFWGRHISYPHTGKAFIAFILGATLWYPLNIRFSDLGEIERVLLKLGGPFEILLAQAMSRRDLVMLKVKSETIYIGYINRNFNPTVQQPSLEMTVVMRGYSAEGTKEEVFDRFYLTPDELAKDPLPLHRLIVTLPVSEVESAQPFDASEYARRFEELRSASVAQVPERPSYDAFSAKHHFELGKQYLLRGDFRMARQQFVHAASKDVKNADYSFFLALVLSIRVLLGNDSSVIPPPAQKEEFARQLELARSFQQQLGRDTINSAIPFELKVPSAATIFELLVNALILDPVKYDGIVQFIVDVADETISQRSDRFDNILRRQGGAFLVEEMTQMAGRARKGVINVINACLKVTNDDPRYYQFIALALAQDNRIVEIDLLAEKLIKMGEWSAAEAVYMLPLKYKQNDLLRASLERVKQRQYPL